MEGNVVLFVPFQGLFFWVIALGKISTLDNLLRRCLNLWNICLFCYRMGKPIFTFLFIVLIHVSTGMGWWNIFPWVGCLLRIWYVSLLVKFLWHSQPEEVALEVGACRRMLVFVVGKQYLVFIDYAEPSCKVCKRAKERVFSFGLWDARVVKI